MALKPCKSCKHQVDARAKTCPNCGVSNPGVTALQSLIGLVFLGVIIAAVGAKCSDGNDNSTVAEKPKIDDATCRKDLQCWGDRQSIAAGVHCLAPVERLAKFSSRWTDGVLEPKFSHFRWLDQSRGTITFIGDKIEFQNGFGAFQAHIYECDFDPTGNQVLSVRAQPGRL